jgi:hypothetical protein
MAPIFDVYFSLCEGDGRLTFSEGQVAFRRTPLEELFLADINELAEDLAEAQAHLLMERFEEQHPAPAPAVTQPAAITVFGAPGGGFRNWRIINALSAGSKCETLANTIVFAAALFCLRDTVPFLGRAYGIYRTTQQAACHSRLAVFSRLLSVVGRRSSCERFLQVEREAIHEAVTLVATYVSTTSGAQALREACRTNSLSDALRGGFLGAILIPKHITQSITQRVCYGLSLTGLVAPRAYPRPRRPSPSALQGILPHGAKLLYDDGVPYYTLKGKSEWCDTLPGWRPEMRQEPSV